MRGHQYPLGLFTAFLNVGCVVVQIAQYKAGFSRQFSQQGGRCLIIRGIRMAQVRS